MIFIVDQYRNGQIAKEKGFDEDSINDMDRFFQGFTDACLMAQNVVTTRKASDSEPCIMGILNNPSRTIKLLKLPKKDISGAGLRVWISQSGPQLKPRMDMKLRMFENSYNALITIVRLSRNMMK